MIEKNKFNQEEVEQFDQLIIKDLNLIEDETMPDFLGNHELREKLKVVIAYLRKKDFHRLVYAMYRLDVKESLFHEAMNQDDPALMVEQLADIIFEREWQKIQTRLLYKKNK